MLDFRISIPFILTLLGIVMAHGAIENSPEMAFRIGGAGGAYFLAEPGPLVVEVEKVDRNRRSTRTEVRLILAGPDREVLAETVIPDDGLPTGKMGAPQRARLTAQVARKGVFLLNVTCSQDRYGEDFLWGLRTNCAKWLLETARGHRDRRHEEPLVLANPGRPGDVCFLPRRGPLSLEISGLPKAVGAVDLFDGRGSLIQRISVDPAGLAACTFAPGIQRDAVPWRLHLPAFQATVQADGLTRWQEGDLCPDSALWTPDQSSFFALPKYRWLLTPYQRTVCAGPGTAGEVVFTIQNNTDQQCPVALSLEFPGTPWPARLSTPRITLGPRQTQTVPVQFTAPPQGETRTCHLRATPSGDADFTTYATIRVQESPAPATNSLAMPLVLQAYRHENERFGYAPDYPADSQFYFDRENRPWARTSRSAVYLENGQWITAETENQSLEAAGLKGPVSSASAKIAFDRDGGIYLVGRAGGQAVLLHSPGRGQAFKAYPIPGVSGGALEIEEFSGHNALEGPPPLLHYALTEADPERIWRRVHDLQLILPRKEGGRILFEKPVLLSRQCIGYAGHSGMPSSLVSRGSMVHVVWAEATDPAEAVPGVPTFVASYDRQSGKLGTPVRVAYGPPANDIHNTPSITMDSRGYLHVLAGTHGRPFPYARSLQPNTAHAGWTESASVAGSERQTYIGLVCGPDDTLHLVFRWWRDGEEPFPASQYAALAYQRKPPGGAWEPPRKLVVPPFSEYSVFYHRLSIDRAGRLLVSYDAWTTHWFYRNDRPGSRRTVLLSPDGGHLWKLLQTGDMNPVSPSLRTPMLPP